MKMQMWTYQSVKNPEQGFTIQEQDERKWSKKEGKDVKTGKKVYSVWIDTYEGGFAYDSDWDCLDNPNSKDGYWKSFDDAYKWIVENYGEIIDTDDVKEE